MRSVRFGLNSFTFDTNSVRGSFESESDVKKGPEATKTAKITMKKPFHRQNSYLYSEFLSVVPF